jgi:hypothetical protein
MMKGARKKNSSHKYGTTMTRRLINAVKRRDAGLGRAAPAGACVASIVALAIADL